ncbi:MAG: D-alanyl-D-alanine carboxypeptidase [Gammaproteobacteria bacterium]|nr:D-alanyl-D-alanine carboxypeptidase [Gammaproteobacteria bacterium]MBU1775323.1 D-alanyl-D-alanine carboxypeptidase [Gammaproteobacteria bacterium]MBU1969638.1 D-alanyl-D-alanine carboxypeptidase [Gammaproteobacteria bacterium]
MRAFLFIGLWLLALTASAVSQPDPFPQVAESYLVEINGETIWERHIGKRLPPASLTKLMTALLVLEQAKLQEIVQVSQAASLETGSRLGLKAGERLHVEDLLAATMLQSANDACHALADHIGGSEAAFVIQMNRRAQQLGLLDTQFRNACGHDAVGHYSTAANLARLARELLKLPQIVPLASQQRSTISTLEGKQYPLSNKNALIGRYDGALGLKTGYTAKAGTCLVALARRDGHEVLLVMLHGKDRWWDAADILDLAFDHARMAH